MRQKNKVYLFRHFPGNPYNIHVAIGYAGVQPQPMPTVHCPSGATYDRFVALANSGKYIVSIQESDIGMGWALLRHRELTGPVIDLVATTVTR